MAENVGSIYVDVSADIAEFVNGLTAAKEIATKEGKEIGAAVKQSIKQELTPSDGLLFPVAAMDSAKATAQTSGSATANSYTKAFSEKFEKWGDQQKARLNARLEKFLDPERFAKSLTEGFNVLNKGGGFGEALAKTIGGIPLVGSFYELGVAAGTYFWGGTRGKAEEAAKQAEIAFLEPLRASILAQKGMRESDAQAKRGRMFEGGLEDESFANRQAKSRAIAAGDLYGAAMADAEEELMGLRKALTADLSKGYDDDENDLIKKRFEREKGLIKENLQFKFNELNAAEDEAIARSAAEQKKVDDALAEDADRAAKKLADDQQDYADDLMKKNADAAKEWAKAKEEEAKNEIDRNEKILAATSMSASTAIGAYQFSAYPEQKQAIDMMKIVSTLQIISTLIPKVGGGIT
jgi:hypothetical protein